jgi:hypothetical protein
MNKHALVVDQSPVFLVVLRGMLEVNEFDVPALGRIDRPGGSRCAIDRDLRVGQRSAATAMSQAFPRPI